VYEGFVAVAVPLVGLITTVAIVPNSGFKVASTDAAPKSCMKFRVRLPFFNPPILVRQPEPKAVVSKSSASKANSTELRFEEKSEPLMVTE